jgi:hypothetical protein
MSLGRAGSEPGPEVDATSTGEALAEQLPTVLERLAALDDEL